MRNNSLIRKVPSEIWLRVFHAFIKEAQLFLNRDTCPFPPFTLSAVCQDWREIALANSAVWDRILVVLPDVHEEVEEEESNLTRRFRRYMDQVELWIERAGERLLSITLTSKDPVFSFGFGCRAAKLVPQLVVKYASRIKELDLTMSTDWYDILTGVEFANLQTLRLNIINVTQQDNECELWPDLRDPISDSPLDFTRCPKLSVTQFDGGFDHINILLPWNQITDISLRYLIPSDCAQVFDRLPNLKRCAMELALCLSSDDSADLDGSEEVVRRGSPFIEDLELDEMLPGTSEIILKSLPLSLKHLLLGSFLQDNGDLRFLLDTIPAYGDTLQSLTIRNTFQDYQVIYDLLPKLPALTFVEIIIPGGLEDHFAKLLTTPGTVPRLKSLKILDLGPTRMGDDALLDLLRFRMGSGNGCDILEAISLRLPQALGKAPLGRETIKELRSMLERGLCIAVVHGWGYTDRDTNLVLGDSM
ncbi:hypothetical protein MD484_g3100, partial [Candolleomyces efflorescens]